MKIISFSQAKDQTHFAKLFSELPQTVRKDPYRVGLLPAEAWLGFLRHGIPVDSDFFLAEHEGKTLGRVGVSRSQNRPDAGYVGFFEVDLGADFESVGLALLTAAENWLKAKGARKIHGPVNLNTWFAYRFRLASPDPLSFAWEPINPPEYPELFEKSGFTVDMNYHSQGWEKPEAAEQLLKAMAPAFDKAKAAGFEFKLISGSEIKPEDMQQIYEISIHSFQDNYLYEPITFEMFQRLYYPLLKRGELILSTMISDAHGKNVAFMFSFLEKDSIVMKTTAVLPEARGKGLSNAVLYFMIQAAMARGIFKIIHPLIQSGNLSGEHGKKSTHDWRHEYVLYAKTIG